MQTTANILDPIHSTLPPDVWDSPESPTPTLKAAHARWIVHTVTSVLKRHGYHDPEKWLSLVLTGSLTTYQYAEHSDCDVSLFVDAEAFPEWSRAEMIGLMVGNVDGTILPGTKYPMQCFVVGKKIKKEDLYKPGLRSGWDILNATWLEPPDPARSVNIEQQRNEAYIYALEAADKMERLLRYEPDRAKDYWHQIHKARQRAQQEGRGDYSLPNIVYKFLANRGLFPEIAGLTGEYIARTAASDEIAQVAYQSTMAHGGVTINSAGQVPNSGFAFSPFKDSELVVPVDQLTPSTFTDYISGHTRALGMPNNYLGAWVEEGNAYIDVSQVWPDKDDALAAARQADQLAIFDLGNFEVIPVPPQPNEDPNGNSFSIPQGIA